MPTQMSRREVIAWLAAGTGAAAAGASVLLNDSGSPAAAPRMTSDGRVLESTGRTTMPRSVAPPVGGERLLVVLEMLGGNDGMSMVVPYGSAAYYDMRQDTAIAQNEVLQIDDEVGLHPNLNKMHKRGITLVEGVGSTVPNGSHFEMAARWWGGHSAVVDDKTGWIGRLADILNDGSTPASALSIGSGAHPIARSVGGKALSIPSVDAIHAVVGADSDDVLSSSFQHALRGFADGQDGVPSTGLIRNTLTETLDFAERLTAAQGGEGNEVESRRERLGYSNSGLSDSLLLAANVFAAETGVRVLHATMDGDFDTHEGHSWRHPELMQDLDDSLEGFHNDLAERGLQDRVMVMTTSEFGRTTAENGSGGLDHGAASVAFLSGPGTGGRRGEYASLTDLDENDDMKATVPLESYIGGVVEGWLGVPSSEVFGTATPLSVI